MVFLTYCIDTGSKRCKEDWVYGSSVGKTGTGMPLSSSWPDSDDGGGDDLVTGFRIFCPPHWVT